MSSAEYHDGDFTPPPTLQETGEYEIGQVTPFELINTVESVPNSSFEILTPSQFFEDIEYLFYGNKNQDYKVKIKFKKEKLPLILR